MPNSSTSPKTYILLVAIATLAIAAVASQVAASPSQDPGVVVTWGPPTYGVDAGCSGISMAGSANEYTISWTLLNDSNYKQCFSSNILIPFTVTGQVYDNTSEWVARMYWDTTDNIANQGWASAWGANPTYFQLYDYIGGGTMARTWDPIGAYYVVTQTGIGGGGMNVQLPNATAPNDRPDLYGTYNFQVRIVLESIDGHSLAPASPAATALPQFALPCITGTTGLSATVQPTMTPYGRTTTPVPTRTPGGPSPTPTAMVTATVRPVSGTASYDSGLITFDNDVNQLSAVGVVNEGPNQFLQWSPEVGNDGRAGVAMLHAGMGDVYTVTAQEMALGSVVAVFKTGGYVGPVAVSLYARNAYTLTVGNQHSLRVWYLDPDYNGPGQGVWITTQSVPSNLGLSNVWRKLGAVVQPTGGSGKISAIAFSDERLNVSLSESLPPCPSGRGCIYIDDLRIAYGASAGLVLPFCDGTDPNGLRNGRTGRACIINLNTIDLRAVCQAPTTLDLGAWLSYLWCNIWRFFGFFQENRDQVDAIIARQSLNEPFGSLSETGAVYDDLNTSVEQLRQSNKSQVQNPIDWVATFMDGSALDHLPQFTMPDIASSAQYMASCPAEAMFSTSTATGACMALYMMRQTVIVTLFQWGLNALFVVGTLMLIRGDLEKLAS